MNIKHIEYALPQHHESIHDAIERLRISKDEGLVFERLFGLEKLPIDNKVKVDELMLSAAEKCINIAKINRAKIKWLIHCHTANHISPFGHSPIKYIQNKLNLQHSIVFGTRMTNCASVFVIFDIANSLFAKLKDQDYILIITGDVSFTKIFQLIPGTTIMTDGACAILLSKNGSQNQFLSIVTKTYGKFASGIWGNQEEQRLFEKNYSAYLSDVIAQLVSNADLRLRDIKLILPHNVNKLSWLQVIKNLKLSQEQVFLKKISQTAHCFGSDPFINYKCADDEGLFENGDYFILATVGLGATFSAMLFRY